MTITGRRKGGIAQSRRQRLDAWLRAHRAWCWGLLLVLAVSGAGLLLWGGGAEFARWAMDPSGTKRYHVALPPDALASPPPPETRLHRDDAAAPVADTDEPEAAMVTPAMDWQDPPRLRRAAALLAEQGDLDAALDLLLTNRHAPFELRDVGRAGYAAIAARLDERLPAELATMRAWWTALPDDQRLACFPYDGERQVSAFTALLGRPADMTMWRELGATMPTSLQYVLIRNLHLDAEAATRLPPALIRMVLSLRMLPGPLLLPTLTFPPDARPLPYADHLGAFAEALDRELLSHLVHEMIVEEKIRLLKIDRELREWYGIVWGEAFCGRLAMQTPTDNATPAQIETAWNSLPGAAQIFWSRALVLRLADDYGYVPAALYEKSTYLAPNNRSLDKAAVLRAIRLHPAWQRALRGCHYAEAVKQARETILPAMYASGYATFIVRALEDRMEAERQVLTQSNFPWERFAQAVDVGEAFPPGLAGGTTPPRRDAAGDKPRYPLWEDVPVDQAAQALRLVARNIYPRTLRQHYQDFAKLYAANRGLLRDESENKRYPMLTPDPLRYPLPPPPAP